MILDIDSAFSCTVCISHVSLSLRVVQRRLLGSQIPLFSSSVEVIMAPLISIWRRKLWEFDRITCNCKRDGTEEGSSNIYYSEHLNQGMHFLLWIQSRLVIHA